MRQRLPDIISVAALIGATAFPLIWTGLAMREPPLLPGPRVGEHLTSHHGQPERAPEFAIREQTGIGRDDGSTKLKHQSAVEIESENIDRKSMASRSILPLPD